MNGQRLPRIIELEGINNEGLSQVTITDMVQDSLGFLWIATRDGLNRFDGDNFKSYYHQRTDSFSIGGSELFDLDYRQGKLWIAYSGGISFYEEKTGRFKNYPIAGTPGLPQGLMVQKLCVTESGILVGTTAGLYFLDLSSGKYSIPNELSGLSARNITAIQFDRDNQLWIGTTAGLYRGDQPMYLDKLSGVVNDIYKDPTSENFYISGSNGLFIVDQTGDIKSAAQPSTGRILEAFQSIRTIDGNLWVAINGGIIVILDPNDNMISTTESNRSISERLNMRLFQERQGVVWVSINGYGLKRYSAYSNRFSKILIDPEKSVRLRQGLVRAIYSDNDTIIYVANVDGLDVVDLANESTTSYNLNLDDKFNTQSFYGGQCFFRDRLDSIWLGTSNGVIKFKAGFRERDLHKVRFAGSSQNPNKIFSIREFDDNHVLMSSSHGLFLVDIKSNVRSRFEKDPINFVSSFTDNISIEYVNGHVWVGTPDGILIFDRSGALVETLNVEKNRLGAKKVKSILNDSRGRVWVSTWGGGLSLYNPVTKTFQNYSVESGLANAVIYGVIEDESNHLWVSTNSGLAYFDVAEERFINFNMSDGISDKEYNTGSYFKSKFGRIYFGGVNGVTHFAPKDIFFAPPTPKTVLVDVFVNNKQLRELDLGKSIHFLDKLDVEWDDRDFAVDVASISFFNTSSPRFRYMLENFDDDWRESKSGGHFSFAHIPSGEYVLKVKSSIDGIRWEEIPLEIPIVIATPFWMRPWVQGIAIFFALVVGLVWYKRRERENSDRTKKLELLVNARTQEIQKQKEAIAAQNSELQSIRLRLEQKFDFASRAGNLGLWTWVKSTKEFQASDQCKAQLGYQSLDVTTKLTSLVHPNDLHEVIRAFNQSKRTPYPELKLEYRVKNKEGWYRWIMTQASPLLDSNGELIQINGINIDITERKQAEELLSKSEERYRLVMYGVRDGIWDWDLVTKEAYLSPRWKEILGYADDDLPNNESSFFDLIHPDDQERVRKSLEEHFQSEQPYHIEIRMRCKNNNYKWVLTRGDTIRDKSGKPLRMMGSTTDIHDQKIAEQNLRESEDKFKAMIANSSDVISIMDSDGQLRYVSQSIQNVLGYTAEERMGASGFDKIHPEDAPRVMKAIDELLKVPGGTATTEYRWRSKGGSWLILESKAINLLKDPRIGGIVINTRDVTERERFAASLKESEAKTRAIIETALDAVVTMSEDGSIVGWNRQATKIFGWSEKEAVGKSLGELIVPARYRERHRMGLKRFLDSGKSEVLNRRFEIFALRNSGEEFPVELAISPILSGGKTMFSAFIRDISERKLALEELKLSESNLREAQHIAKIGNFEFYIETGKLKWSDEVHSIFGVPLSEKPTLATYQSRLQESDFDRVMQLVKQCIDTGEGYFIEHELLLPGGLKKYVQARSRAVKDLEGKVTKIFGVVQDVTERKLAQLAIQESEQRLSQAIRVSSIGIFDHDHFTNKIFWSQEIRDIYRVGPDEEITIEKIIDLTHPDDRVRVAKAIAAAHDPHGDGLFDIEYKVIDRKNEVRWVMTRSQTSFELIGGKLMPVRTVGAAIDITDRKNSENALQEKELLLRTIAENYPNSYLSIVENDFTIGYTAGQAFRKLGLDPNQFIGLTVDQVFGDHAGRVKENFVKAFNGEEVTFDLFINNQYQTYSVVPLIDGEGKISRVLSVAEDITDRRKSELALKESEERLRQAVQVAQIGIFDRDFETDTLYLSAECQEISGMEGTSVLAFEEGLSSVHEDDKEKVVEGLKRAADPNSDGLFEVEYRFFDKHGKMRWLSMTSQTYFEGTGNNRRPVRAVGAIINISERKNNEEKIHIFSNRLQLAIKAGNIGLWEWNLVTNDVFFSPEWKAQLGYQDHELENSFEAWDSRLHPDDKERVMNSLTASLKEPWPVHSVEFRLRHKDGLYRWILASGSLEFDKKQQPIKMYGTHVDITERKIAEQELIFQKSLLERNLESTVDRILIVDSEGSIIKSNRLFREMWNFDDERLGLLSNQEIIEHIAYQTIDPDQYIAEAREARKRLFDVHKNEAQCVNGSVIERYVAPIFDNERVYLGRVLSFRDITERRKAETEIRGLSNIVQNTLSEVFVFEKENFRFRFANHAALENLGYSRDEILEMTPVDIKPEHTQESFQALVIPLLTGAVRSVKFETTHQRKNGTIYPVEVNLQLSEFEGREMFAAISLDISTRRAAETALRNAKDAAEDANRAKTEFLANMSHEIRTPMNAILGFSEVLLNTTKDTSSKGYLKTIISSGKTLLSLINDLLDLSKIESGAIEIKPEPVEVGSVLDDIKEMFRHQCQKKGIDFLLNLPSDFPGALMLDEIRLRQVIINLVGNAVKFTSHGGVTVSVTASPENKKDNFLLEFKVSDTGIGIEKSDHELIFESFRQAKDVNVKHFGGTGLGLAITKRLVNLMGGRVEVESEPGKGSTFCVVIPNVTQLRGKYHKSDELKWDSSTVHFKNSKLLVVDDVVLNTLLIESYLDRHGLEIIRAANGKEAVEKAQEYRPAAVLMDFRMPVMDGREAALKIRSDKNLDIPLIAFTASVQGMERERVKETFDGFLMKPVTKSTLINELKKHLPYDVITSESYQTNDDDVKISLSDVEYEQFKDHALQLQKHVVDKVRRLLEAMDLQEMDLLIKQLKDYAEKNKLLFLNDYTKRLIELYEVVDIESIEEHLNYFLEIVENFSKETYGQ